MITARGCGFGLASSSAGRAGRTCLEEELVDPKGQAVLRGLHRVLAPAGRFISVAWGADRRKMADGSEWRAWVLGVVRVAFWVVLAWFGSLLANRC